MVSYANNWKSQVMKTITKLFVILFSINTHANGYLSDNHDSIIEWINLEPHVIRVGFTSPSKKNPDSCGSDKAVLLKQENNYEKATYASLLAAMHSGKKVRFYAAGCMNGWGTTYPKIKAVYIYK